MNKETIKIAMKERPYKKLLKNLMSDTSKNPISEIILNRDEEGHSQWVNTMDDFESTVEEKIKTDDVFLYDAFFTELNSDEIKMLRKEYGEVDDNFVLCGLGLTEEDVSKDQRLKDAWEQAKKDFNSKRKRKR